MHHSLFGWLTALLLYVMIAPGIRAQAAVLTILGAGLTVGEVLDKAEAAATNIISRATEGASLAGSAAAKNALLAAAALRQQLNDDLSKQWDKLDQEKRGMLAALDKVIQDANAGLGRVERLEELATLDAESLIKALSPIASLDYAIKGVDGTAQYFRADGTYRFVLRGNVFDAEGKNYRLRLGCKDAKPWASPSRQFEIRLNVPAGTLNSFDPRRCVGLQEKAKGFSDRHLGLVYLYVDVDIPNRKFWEFWKDETRTAQYKIAIDLFPKFPILYLLQEAQIQEAVDTERIEWQPSEVQTIGGCGKSGCYSYHNVHAYVPPGGIATGAVRNCTDTFNGWGDFVKPGPTVRVLGANLPRWVVHPCNSNERAISVSPNVVMMLYQQHSHNHSRNVRFEAAYHPRRANAVFVHRGLKPLPLPGQSAPISQTLDAPTTASAAAGARGSGTPAMAKQSDSFIQSVTQALLADVAPNTNRSTGSAIRSSAKGTPKAGYLAYGQAYEAVLSNSAVGWTLQLKTFNGDLITVTEVKKDSRVFVDFTNQANYKRVLVEARPPW
jgi:hypothetical protein